MPIVTLTTDFGVSDHYAGTMKGVILSICPRARIVDISHDVAAYAISEGAYLIAQAYRFFPKKTVHVVVVDPGVGTSRRALLAEAAGQFFVAPDNGVLSMILAREKHTVRALTNTRYFRKPVSRTFHGRDIFSPVAAHLAAGKQPARMGKKIDDYMRSDFAQPKSGGNGHWIGQILRIDRFGNVVTNFQTEDLPSLADGAFLLRAGGRTIRRQARQYADVPPGELFVLVGSGGYLEISINQGSAAQAIGCERGQRVELQVG